MSPCGKTKAVLTIHQQGNDMAKIVSLFLKFLSEKNVSSYYQDNNKSHWRMAHLQFPPERVEVKYSCGCLSTFQLSPWDIYGCKGLSLRGCVWTPLFPAEEIPLLMQFPQTLLRKGYLNLRSHHWGHCQESLRFITTQESCEQWDTRRNAIYWAFLLPAWGKIQSHLEDATVEVGSMGKSPRASGWSFMPQHVS